MGARVVPVANPQVRYEHLGGEPPKFKGGFKQYVLFGLAVTLIVLLVLVTAYNGWEEFTQTEKKLKADDVDFVMYGPVRTELGVQGIQERRADVYAEAFNKKHQFLEKSAAIDNVKSDEEWLLPKASDERSSPTMEGFKFVCYYSLPTKSNILDSNTLKPSELDAHLCTHINLAFASVSRNRLVPSNPYDIETYDQVNKLKNKNPHLKVLLSVNGDMSQVIQDHSTRKTFIKSAVGLLRQHNFDGLDIDWEFPDDAWKFMTLLAEFRQEFGHKFLLTAAVAAPQFIADTSYKINVMSRYVDWVNLMTYDFHFYTRYSPFTGLNSPLFNGPKDEGYFSQLNINWTSNYWVAKGMPRHKIVIGIPTYGHTFKLVNKKNSGLYAPASSFGEVGGSGGFIDYADVCTFLTSGDVTQVFDRSTRSPYAFKNYDWVSFDDERSVAYKTEFITSKEFGGAMIWSLNSDDHKGLCYQSGDRFPLSNRIKNVLADDQL